MRKVYLVTTFIIVLLVSFLGITYSYEYNENESLEFELIGPYEITLKLGDVYYEYGIKVMKNNKDISSLVNINKTSLDVGRVGQYKVKYELLVDGNIEYIYRIVNIKEYVSPQIKLIGDEVIYLNLHDTYVEMGYDVSDNYDDENYLNNNVVVTSNLMIDVSGEYSIEYKVTDSSGNEAIAVRKIIVK